MIQRVIRAFVGGRPVYVIPRDDGTLTLGASSREDQSTHPNVGAIHDLLRDAIRLIPGLADCELMETGVGARPGTPDDLPYLGKVGENLIVSTGYFRHGILLAALAGQTVADQVTTGAVPPDLNLAACDPWRHGTPPTTRTYPDTNLKET